MKPNLIELKLNCLAMPVGTTTRRATCPRCGKDKDFSVTRTANGILYNCFRAACGTKGFINIKEDVYTPPQIHVAKNERIFNYPTCNLSHNQIRVFQGMFESCPTARELTKQGIVWCEELDRVIFPCFTKGGGTWGHVARKYPELDPNNKTSGQPKTINYKAKASAPSASWIKRDKSDGIPLDQQKKVVLVEDIVSGIAMSRYFHTVALLGHKIPRELWLQLTYNHVIVCLDADVKAKSLEYLRKYSMYAEKVDSIFIDRDPKNMTFTMLMDLKARIYKL